MTYKRVIFKLSGEFVGEFHELHKQNLLDLASDIKYLQSYENMQFIIVLGGGNVMRGRDFKKIGLDRVTSDHMGILATLMNSLCVRDIFQSVDFYTEILSSISISRMFQSYSVSLVQQLLTQNICPIIGGGVGLPYFSTDSVAALVACELHCHMVFKGTDVQGVYSQDPKKNQHNAEFYSTRTYNDLIGNSNLSVMDDAALILCRDEHIPIVITSYENRLKDMFKNGEFIGKGTIIS